MLADPQITRVEILQFPEQFYFKISAAAKYLGISANTLRKYTDLGLITAKRLPSGDRLYRKEALDEFYDQLPDAIEQATSYNQTQSDLSSNPRKGGWRNGD